MCAVQRRLRSSSATNFLRRVEEPDGSLHGLFLSHFHFFMASAKVLPPEPRWFGLLFRAVGSEPQTKIGSLT